jgi:hypothetical protein
MQNRPPGAEAVSVEKQNFLSDEAEETGAQMQNLSPGAEPVSGDRCTT